MRSGQKHGPIAPTKFPLAARVDDAKSAVTSMTLLFLADIAANVSWTAIMTPTDESESWRLLRPRDADACRATL